MNRSTLIGLGTTAVIIITSAASAGVTGTTGGDSFGPPGWDVPPASLGGWTMVQYDDVDPLVAFNTATNIAHSNAVPSHTTSFNVDANYLEVGSGWATWSGGYTGGVYWADDALEMTLTPSAGTVAYSLFFQPNPFEPHDFEVTAFDNLGNFFTVDTVTDGSGGATWAGFWTDGSTEITSIRVTSDAEFAVGRFGYAIPAPGAVALLGLGGLIARRRRN